MNKIIVIGIIILISIGAIIASTRQQDTISDITADKPYSYPDVTLVDYDGNEVKLSDFDGQPIIANSWAVWCPFCKKELADFVSLQEEFENVVVIAINRQESLDKNKGYTDSLGISEKILFLLDDSDSFYKLIGGFSMPETIFVNSAGEIVVHKRGPMTLEEMREHTRKIIDLKETQI